VLYNNLRFWIYCKLIWFYGIRTMTVLTLKEKIGLELTFMIDFTH